MKKLVSQLLFVFAFMAFCSVNNIQAQGAMKSYKTGSSENLIIRENFSEEMNLNDETLSKKVKSASTQKDLATKQADEALSIQLQKVKINNAVTRVVTMLNAAPAKGFIRDHKEILNLAIQSGKLNSSDLTKAKSALNTIK